ncbi:hypothetical protein K2173_025581 [Erythroxylum novogranatense]|uniref:Uncharacterized protein n=1 Tax=Erythroxylum novogranatense TaxID=1862640 RepID=A0AAV8T8R4_9ROSI|nr:hypothetical protein K2173_025581 [Erythroxylum novogranatense]
MLCLVLWYNALTILLAGYTKGAATEVSAFSICLNVRTFEFMLCFCFLAASSVRVSNELGRGNAKAANFSIKVNVWASFSLYVYYWVIRLPNCLQMKRRSLNLYPTFPPSVLLNSFETVLTGYQDWIDSGRGTVPLELIGISRLITHQKGLIIGSCTLQMNQMKLLSERD